MLALVRFLRAIAFTDARKSLTGRDWVMVSPICASWNQVDAWLRQVDGLRQAA
mgnify:FL=1